jgi:uncharacterized membrane protein YgcG
MGYAELERRGNDRVEGVLEAYAQARLDAAPPVLARIRANVLAQAATMASTPDELHTPSLAPASSRFAWLMAPVARRAYSLGLAASLTLGTTAAVLAAPPGSPFYNARLVIEAALLPTQADARLAAYEGHLTERLHEAEVAAAAGDGDALAAALAAYESDVAAAFSAVGDDPELLDHLEAMLARHTAVLEALEARVPDQASVDRAIVSSQKAIDRINEKAANGGTNGGNGGAGGKGGNGGTGGNDGNGGNGGRPSTEPGRPPDSTPDDPPGGEPENDDSQ